MTPEEINNYIDTQLPSKSEIFIYRLRAVLKFLFNSNAATVFTLAHMTIRKRPGNNDLENIEPGDWVTGWWDRYDYWQQAIYIGGPIDNKDSYYVYTQSDVPEDVTELM